MDDEDNYCYQDETILCTNECEFCESVREDQDEEIRWRKRHAPTPADIAEELEEMRWEQAEQAIDEVELVNEDTWCPYP